MALSTNEHLSWRVTTPCNFAELKLREEKRAKAKEKNSQNNKGEGWAKPSLAFYHRNHRTPHIHTQ